MTRNEGNTDRIVRIVLGLGILGLGVATQSWLGLIGLVPLLTGTLGWCPIYTLFGLSTCPVKSKS